MDDQTITWNLADLYAGVDDPAIDAAVTALESRAAAFADRYRGQLVTLVLEPAAFAAVVRDYEAIVHDGQFPSAYAYLLFAGDTRPPAHGALIQRMQEASVAIHRHLLFFELELLELSDDEVELLLAHAEVAVYRHYLQHVRDARPHRLSEPEERILLEKSASGREAFSRLFDETIGDLQFTLVEEGDTKRLTEAEVLARLYHPDRAVRQAAAASLTAGLRERERLFTFITNTLAYDKSVDDRLTNFPHPEASRHLSDEVDTETVHTMLEACVAFFPTVARYYRLKREILGLDTLYHYDRYAPIALEQLQLPWSEAQRIVVDAYADFTPALGHHAARFFTERWIDAEARPGKRGGAFCMGIAPDWHPYVLMSYLGRPRDVMTLAHELGHGLHDLLAADQPFLHYSPSLATAETASVFGEMLTFRALLAGTTSAQERLALLTGKLEDIFATVFRQSAMYRFEQAVHAARRAQGELPTEAISALWQENQQAMFGDSVELGEEHRSWWMYIPHFIHTPFYVYAYAFGQLLVMALIARYQQEGAAFVPAYLDILRAGGSQRPADIMRAAGIELSERAFWEGGLRMIDDLVSEAEATWREG